MTPSSRITPPSLFKCRIAYEYDANDVRAARHHADMTIDRARAWLSDNGRLNHFINIYDNGKHGLTTY